MKTNPSWKDWFLHSKRDRNAFVILLVSCSISCPFLFFYHPASEQPVIKNLDEEIAQLAEQQKDSAGTQPALFSKTTSTSPQEEATLQPFYFDPNTLDEAGFQQLGLRERTIHTILNYRSKGGRFYKPDDLRKIYGLREEEADMLIPYVRMEKGEGGNQQYGKNNEFALGYKKAKPQIIDINRATPEQWKTLPAIGDVLSERIVKYRDKKGGFASVEEIKKVYGLSDSAYQIIHPYLSISTTKPLTTHDYEPDVANHKININKATVNDLKANPAISSDIAQAIVIYRGKHGAYTSVEDIKKIIFINDETYQHISPYLTVE